MEIYFQLFILIVLALMLLISSRRSSLSICSNLIMAYILLAMATYIMTAEGISSEYYLQVININQQPAERVLLTYTVLFLIAWGSTITSKKTSALNQFNLTQIKASIRRHSPILLIGIYIILGVNLISFDYSVLWSNNQYLLMNGPGGYKRFESISMLFSGLLNVSGIISASLLAYSIVYKKPINIIICLVPFLFISLYEFSAHSRSTSLYIFSFFMTYILMCTGRVRKVVALFIAGTSIVFAINHALNGRGSGSHGFAHIFTISESVTHTNNIDSLLFTWQNLMQGILVNGEALAIPRTVQHEPIYKVLSFSPLPSFIDNFQTVRQCCEIRINRFMPLSSIVEIIRFGVPYMMISSVLFFLLLRKVNTFNTRNQSFSTLLLSLYVFSVFVIANTYPTRNVFRLFLLSYFAIEALRYFAKKVNREHQAKHGY